MKRLHIDLIAAGFRCRIRDPLTVRRETRAADIERSAEIKARGFLAEFAFEKLANVADGDVAFLCEQRLPIGSPPRQVLVPRSLKELLLGAASVPVFRECKPGLTARRTVCESLPVGSPGRRLIFTDFECDACQRVPFKRERPDVGIILANGEGHVLPIRRKRRPLKPARGYGERLCGAAPVDPHQCSVRTLQASRQVDERPACRHRVLGFTTDGDVRRHALHQFNRRTGNGLAGTIERDAEKGPLRAKMM